MNQLTRNKGGYPFYTKLFPALMQGERTEASVIAALDRIYQHQDLFDDPFLLQLADNLHTLTHHIPQRISRIDIKHRKAQSIGSKFEQPDAELGYGIPDVYKAYKQERKYAAESK